MRNEQVLRRIVTLGKERQFAAAMNDDYERVCVFLYEWTCAEIGRLEWATNDPEAIVRALMTLQEQKRDKVLGELGLQVVQADRHCPSPCR